MSFQPVLLACSFLRPIRAALGEHVNSEGWVHGPPPFLESSPLVDFVDSSTPNPFFRGGPEDHAGIRSQEKRERYFQNRLRSLLYPTNSVDHPDDASGQRCYSTEVITLTPWQPPRGARSSQAAAKQQQACR